MLDGDDDDEFLWNKIKPDFNLFTPDFLMITHKNFPTTNIIFHQFEFYFNFDGFSFLNDFITFFIRD